VRRHVVGAEIGLDLDDPSDAPAGGVVTDQPGADEDWRG
jgi:hypothetical protein